MFRRQQEEPTVHMGSIPLAYVYGKQFHILPVILENVNYSRDPYTGQAVRSVEFIRNEVLRLGGRSSNACGWGRTEPMTSVPNIHRLAHTKECCKRVINNLGVTPVMITYIDFLRLDESDIQEQIAKYSYAHNRKYYFDALGQWDAVKNTDNVFYPQPE